MGVNFSTSSDKKYVTELNKKKGKTDENGNIIEGEEDDQDNDKDQDETKSTTIDENAITTAKLNEKKNENADKEKGSVTTTIADKKIPDDPNHKINQYVREFIDKKTQADADINAWCTDKQCAEMEFIKAQMIKEFEDLIEVKDNLKDHLKAKYRGLKGGKKDDDDDNKIKEEIDIPVENTVNNVKPGDSTNIASDSVTNPASTASS